MVGDDFVVASLLLLLSLDPRGILSTFPTIEIFGAGGASGIVEDRGLGAPIEPHGWRGGEWGISVYWGWFVAKSCKPSFTTGYLPGKTVGIDPVFARCVVVILSDT